MQELAVDVGERARQVCLDRYGQPREDRDGRVIRALLGLQRDFEDSTMRHAVFRPPS